MIIEYTFLDLKSTQDLVLEKILFENTLYIYYMKFKGHVENPIFTQSWVCSSIR